MDITAGSRTPLEGETPSFLDARPAPIPHDRHLFGHARAARLGRELLRHRLGGRRRPRRRRAQLELQVQHSITTSVSPSPRSCGSCVCSREPRAARPPGARGAETRRETLPEPDRERETLPWTLPSLRAAEARGPTRRRRARSRGRPGRTAWDGRRRADRRTEHRGRRRHGGQAHRSRRSDIKAIR